VRPPALLALADGTVLRGESIGAPGQAVGEVVFNTAMSGYQEILTDPSYCRQLVTLTCAHVGNTGVTAEDEESGRVFAAGLVVRDLPARHSSWRAEAPLEAFLARRAVVAVAGVDTRRLTRLLREGGAQAGCLAAGERLDADAAIAAARDFPGLAGMDLAREVSVTQRYAWHGGVWRLGRGHGPGRAGDGPCAWHVVAFDFGVKRNILRMLTERGCRVTVVPAHTGADAVLALDPDGVFLSNGPGDPEPCAYAIGAIRELLGSDLPVFGICLGLQLLALACGARTVKMKFGHHGANHPVLDLDSGRVLITSQNHGFAVDGESLPPELALTHRSLFDGTVQGVRVRGRPAFGFQGHPEASPGPHDAGYLFDRFVGAVETAALERRGAGRESAG